ncbi:acetylglutamate kinase [Alkalimonas collagenimarina]|uniref:Acetylglutamate kinase n=1 Tax=Alkalimonas collagenimarina TaxID=400390 RepID=A0ABT9H2I3_9GAMM|nr:acetylglutamate kinase [Alkalimonas collagenimarina]MDP4537279.1 acetylglutamate kinase [Alkalimonas collagenimarina]
MSDSRTLVLKLGGRLLQDPSALTALLQICRQLKRQRPLLLVHGGGAQVDQWLQQFGFTTEKLDGQRVSPPEQMPVICGALAGAVNAELVGLADTAGLRPVGLTLAAGGSCHFQRNSRLGAVAHPVPADPALLQQLLAADWTPVVSSIGHDEAGQLLNINADLAAAALCQLLHGQLVLLTDVAGVLDSHGNVVAELSSVQAAEMVSNGEIQGGMKVKLDAALDTAKVLNDSIIVAGWQQPDALLALVTGDAVGTRISVK